MTDIRPNANFYSIGGKSVHDGGSVEYSEYRRCWQENPVNFVLRDFPLHLDLEATSRCNLRCTFCDKLPLLKKGQLGDMDFDLYKRMIDEGREHKLWGVKLSYRGEPLLHPKIAEMVAYAKKNGVLDVYFNTNGMLLKEDMASRLIDSGLNRISISIEGTSAEKFEKERIGASLDVIVRNIEGLRELREKKKTGYPKIRIQTVFYPDADVSAYRNKWQTLCDEVAAVDYKDESRREKGIVRDWACPQLWQRMTIEWDGTVLPCNNDDIRSCSPGNSAEKSIYDCWHDEKVENMRLAHKSGHSDEIKDCDGCPWRTAQINKNKLQAPNRKL